MHETHPRRQLGRSLLALLAGMLAGIILSIGTDVLLHVIGLFPPLGQPVSNPPPVACNGLSQRLRRHRQGGPQLPAVGNCGA